MPRYADDSKEKVLDAVDMVDLVQTRTELRRAGTGRYMGRCPFHDERTASFSVDAERKLYHCFGCGVGGSAFDFVMATEGLDFPGSLESLAARFGVELEVADEDPQAAERRRHRDRLLELLERAAAFYVRWLWDSAEAEPARAYLRDRGLNEDTLREFRVGYAPSAWDKLLMAGRRQGFSNRELYEAGLAVRAKGEGRIYDRFRRRIMFPLCDPRGRVLGFGARALGAGQQPKYLNSADGEVFHKGDHVFAAHLARVPATRADRVVACEGYTDVLAFHQAGIRNTVGIMGTALTEKQVGELAKLGKTVLLALDADSAGQEAMIRAARLAVTRQLELRVVPLPKGLDPADLVQQQGAEAAAQLVEASVPFVRFRIERELEQGDLANAEGKDRVVEALKPVFATLPPSALREELLAHVADQLDLSPSLVSSWLPLPLPGRRPGPVRRAGPRRVRGAAARGARRAGATATTTAGPARCRGRSPRALSRAPRATSSPSASRRPTRPPRSSRRSTTRRSAATRCAASPPTSRPTCARRRRACRPMTRCSSGRSRASWPRRRRCRPRARRCRASWPTCSSCARTPRSARRSRPASAG
ncbi:DNA primase [Baekduia soli]|uniref:DNA primase n=1 Tax=Baekduia soli TaxID=496014 RepID=A0A5B8U8J7_9ACTN|nr:DNA primase [Baekduia soli]QEC49241.1 DNA primase [Baekduia soli]